MKNVHTCESFLRVSDCFIEIEKDLDDVLRKGDLDAIDQKVTPKTLARCKTNTLLKSFQVGLVTIFANFTGYILFLFLLVIEVSVR